MCIFFAGNSVVILSLFQLNVRTLRFVVHSVLATKCYQASNAELSRELCSTSAGGPPPPKQQKLHLGAKQVNGRELKKLVGWYVVEEMLYLNTDDSPSLSAIIEKIPSTINAVLPHRTSFCSYSEKSEGCAECK